MKMLYKKAPILAAVLGLAIILIAAAALADQKQNLAERIQKRYQSIDGIKAIYQRESRFVASGSQAKRRVSGMGVLTWSRPMSLRLDQKEPKAEMILVDRETVWWVRYKRKRADVYPFERFTAGLRPLLDALGGLAGLDQAFILEPPTPEETAMAQGGEVLVLIPKRKRADLTRLTLWFAKDLVLKGFMSRNLVGDTTRYTLHEMKINPEINPADLKYTPSEDFKVRDHRKKVKG